MAGLIQYLDTDGVRVLTEEIKKRIANVYDIKGSAVYADTAYLAAKITVAVRNSMGL